MALGPTALHCSHPGQKGAGATLAEPAPEQNEWEWQGDTEGREERGWVLTEACEPTLRHSPTHLRVQSPGWGPETSLDEEDCL